MSNILSSDLYNKLYLEKTIIGIFDLEKRKISISPSLLLDLFFKEKEFEIKNINDNLYIFCKQKVDDYVKVKNVIKNDLNTLERIISQYIHYKKINGIFPFTRYIRDLDFLIKKYKLNLNHLEFVGTPDIILVLQTNKNEIKVPVEIKNIKISSEKRIVKISYFQIKCYSYILFSPHAFCILISQEEENPFRVLHVKFDNDLSSYVEKMIIKGIYKILEIIPGAGFEPATSRFL